MKTVRAKVSDRNISENMQVEQNVKCPRKIDYFST